MVKLVNAQPNGKKFKFKYSTAHNYLQALKRHEQKNDVEWPVYKGDFLPLNSNHPAHFWTGYFSSRPNFKRLLREASGTAMASNTLYSLDYLREGEKSQSFQFYKGVIPRLKETVATMVHHDTITGSSMPYVVQNATAQVEAMNKANGEVLTRVVTDKVMQEEGLKVDNLQWCNLHKVNERPVCMQQMGKDQRLVTVVYNPSIFEQEYAMIQMPHANIIVSVWEKDQGYFVLAESEAACSVNPEGLPECDIFIFTTIPPMSFSILRIEYSPQHDVSIPSPVRFLDLSNPSNSQSQSQ